MIARGAAVCGVLLWPALAMAGSVKASSELKDTDGVRHTAAMAFDGQLATGWAEGVDGEGDGSWIEVNLDRTTAITSVSLWPGNISNGERSLKEHGRPLTVTITLSGGGDEVTKTERLPDLVETGPVRVDIPIEGDARKVRISVDEALEGYVFNDTYINEIAINFTGGPGTDDEVAKIAEWLGSSAGASAAEKGRAEVIDLFGRISAAQFGDSDALDVLMARAADGAPYAQDRVSRYVPYGFRVQALPPDAVAVDALLKLKDANAIPAIEMAALRLHGSAETTLLQKVEMFHAYQEMVSGGRRNIPPWGTEGWEKGALRSFGEPLAVEIDQYGGVYVADTGNNRVQRYNPQRGLFEAQFGSQEPDITNVWLDGTRDYYASGAKPGTDAGQLVLPVDLAIIPGKDADGMVVLGGNGRVTRYDESGRPVISWDVRSMRKLDDRVGGEGYIEYLKGDKVAVFWTDEAFVYDLNGEELATWEIADGTPNGSVAFRNGKIGLIFGKQLILYSTDGFRFGSIMGDELGEGFESWDVTLDEKGKLWAVTDTGTVFKYKKPGKIDYTVPIADYSMRVPRIAAFDDFVFVTERDKVIPLDALETRARLDAEAAEAAEKAK